MSEFNLKIIGKIELPEKKPRPEDYRGLLETKMFDIGNQVNKEFACDLLDSKASILMAGSSSLESDKKFVSDLENKWASEQRKTVDDWHKSKDRNPATIAEMAVTVVLHKLLGERFIVARSSTFDDYKYGVDNVLIDKETGAVVCGFDEVLGFEGDDGGEKKNKKIKETLSHGGTSLKYGATILDGQIKRQNLENIPTFFLSLSKDELNTLLLDLKINPSSTENEKKLILKMVTSLENQAEEAKKIVLNYNLQKNLEKFATSIEIIKKQINQ